MILVDLLNALWQFCEIEKLHNKYVIYIDLFTVEPDEICAEFSSCINSFYMSKVVHTHSSYIPNISICHKVY